MNVAPAMWRRLWAPLARRSVRTLEQKYENDLDDNPPDASPLSVIVEHPVPLLPDDVLGLLPHDVLHHALELDGGAEVVEDLVLNLLMTLVDNLDGRN